MAHKKGFRLEINDEGDCEWFYFSGITNEIIKNMATADGARGRKLTLIGTEVKYLIELLRDCLSPS